MSDTASWDAVTLGDLDTAINNISSIRGEFGAVQFFRGQGYRVDTSSEAGDRWDKNLTGFRGEEEIAFDARPSVYAGKFQRVSNAVP